MLQQNSSCSLPSSFSILPAYPTDYTTWPSVPCSCCVPEKTPAQPQAIPAKQPDDKVGYCELFMLSFFPQTQSLWLPLVLQWTIIPGTPHPPAPASIPINIPTTQVRKAGNTSPQYSLKIQRGTEAKEK